MPDLLNMPKPVGPAVQRTERKQKEYKFTDPKYLRLLCDAVDTHKIAAEKIGVSQTAVSNALRDDRATVVMENAARGIYEREFKPRGGAELTVTLKIANNQWAALEPWLEESGVHYAVMK